MDYKHVVLLQVFLKYEPENCVREIRVLAKRIGSTAKACAHDKRHIGFVMVSRETPSELLERLGPVLEVDCFTNYFAVLVLGKPAGKHGGMNSLVTRINLAFAAIENSPTKYLTESQTTFEQRLGKRAPREMGVERGRNG